MKSEKIYDAITDIPDEMVQEAVSKKLKRNHQLRHRILAGAAAAVFLVVGMGGYIYLALRVWGNSSGRGVPGGVPVETTVPVPTQWVGTGDTNGEGPVFYTAEDYASVLSVLQDVNNRWQFNGVDYEASAEWAPVDTASPTGATADGAADVMEKNSATMSPTASDEGGSNDYSQTNTQVENVDEADIVKTDGEFIYRLRYGEVVILRADGKDSSVVSRIAIDGSDSQEGSASDTVFVEFGADALDMFLFEDRLVVLKYTYSFAPYYDWEEPVVRDDSDVWADRAVAYNPQSTVTAEIYDISDRSNPRFVDEIGQEGYYISSRMIGDVLYLISNYSVYGISEPDRPETYIPCVYRDGAYRMVEPTDICIGTNVESAQYVVVSAISVGESKLLSTQSVLGGGWEVYMSTKNLYVANSRWDVNYGTPYEEDMYTVQEVSEGDVTSFIRFSLNEGKIEAAAEGEVQGSLLNQFSMDEKDGYLRVVTTTNSYSYKTYTDAEHGWTNWDWKDSGSANALYVLSSDLSVVGAVENLAPDENVYSVRFDGDVGYFVTFRQVDPLFTVDLSDPTNPTVMSKLKIPGFSQYLHPYMEGRLFGLGMDADENTGWTESMKMSMFDVSDPYDVTEKHTLLLESYFSDALYNHRAILISEARDLIGFPTDDGYAIYGYSDERGFYPRAKIRSDVKWGYGELRGLYINDCFYVIGSEDMHVFSMENFTELAKVALD